MGMESFGHPQELGAGEQKINEYVTRIQSGESKDSIFDGLPDSFRNSINQKLDAGEAVVAPESVPSQYEGMSSEAVEEIWTIPEYLDPEKTKQEHERKERVLEVLRKEETQSREGETSSLNTQARTEDFQKDLGIDSGEILTPKQGRDVSIENGKQKNNSIARLVELVSEGRKQVVKDAYKNLLDTIDDPESRKNLAHSLFGRIYDKYRLADYPTNPDEQEIWENALRNTKVGINNKKNEWMYRGIFPKNGEETVTRGSFNVTVTPELISSLDDMIASGKIKANYKFGQPGTTASPTERHDSISIYFLEQPTGEALQELTATIKPYVRGDNLLGKKIDDGFFMSEVGSIETKHIESFVDALKSKDSAFAGAVKEYTSPRADRGTSLQMSEAQYYAIKDVARAFGYEISYDKDAGFEIK